MTRPNTFMRASDLLVHKDRPSLILQIRQRGRQGRRATPTFLSERTTLSRTCNTFLAFTFCGCFSQIPGPVLSFARRGPREGHVKTPGHDLSEKGPNADNASSDYNQPAFQARYDTIFGREPWFEINQSLFQYKSGIGSYTSGPC